MISKIWKFFFFPRADSVTLKRVFWLMRIFQQLTTIQQINPVIEGFGFVAGSKGKDTPLLSLA